MEKRQMLWKTKGMNQDLSVSAFNPEFAFENMNLRLSTNEHNTLMSWVNEKGTKELGVYSDLDTTAPLDVLGTPIGVAILNHKLVIFTHQDAQENTDNTDRIYVLWKYVGDKIVGRKLYEGDLNFREDHPLETLVSYEMSGVEKVYWVDGRNQPRVVNIAAEPKTGVDTQFDFVPALGLQESINVSKSAASGGGLFAPGVIQYGFTYVNKYGQESNMVMISPIQYLSHTDRGASPEEKVTDSFTIQIDNVDQNFDYVRLYSIHRSSLNDVPQVKMLEEIPVSNSTFSEEYIYSDDPFASSFTKTLPINQVEEDLRKVLGAKVRNGFYRVNYTPTVGSRFGYSYNRESCKFDFYYYSDDSATLHYIMSFQQLMYNLMTDEQHPGYADYIDLHKYFAQFQIDGVIKGILLDGIVTSSTPRIALKISDNVVFLEADILDKYLVYYFGYRKWYICDTAASEVKIENEDIIYTDNGTTGVSVDPQSLLYIGGKEITALTMTEKDKTLFLGNIEEKSESLVALQEFYLSNPPTIEPVVNTQLKSVKRDDENPNDKPGFYSYQTQLGNSRRQITTFKGGELYRLGVQFQKVTGEWSEPIFLGDVINTIYPNSKLYEEDIALPFFQASIDFSNHSSLINSNKYKKIRPVIVYPTIGDRKVLCQGVLNPTVFNVEDREQKLPFAQASWYFRPYMGNPNPRYIEDNGSIQHQKSQYVEFVHYEPLPSETDTPYEVNPTTNKMALKAPMLEVQGSMPLYTDINTAKSALYESNIQFFVDQSIVTLNSPDIDFDTEVQSYGTDGLKLRIVGAIPITGNASAHKIEISSGMVQLSLNADDPPSINSFGRGELADNTLYSNITEAAGNRLVSDFLWEDAGFTAESSDETPKTEALPGKFNVYPWQRTGPMNNDHRSQEKASSWLKKKKESNLLYSINTEYLSVEDIATVDFGDHISTQFHLTENNYINNIRLPKQKNTSSDINYYPNIDRILTTTKSTFNGASYNGYLINVCKENGYYKLLDHPTTLPISMRYKSTSHAVIALNSNSNDEYPSIPILPYGIIANSGGGHTNVGQSDNLLYTTTFWGDTTMRFSQSSINMDELFHKPSGGGYYQPMHNWLWLGELYKESVNPFGGTGREAILANNWVVGGDEVDFTSSGPVTLRWTEGDTYFQRYDCLKTYPFTQEDTNQLVEILSFMVETHVNLDGRYDKNRGQQVSYNMTPENFNLINPVYSQEDNFFTYKKIDVDSTSKKYPNQIAYSLTKTSGADVDAWTNVNLGSVLELDGDKGKISKLARLNDKLIAFQDSGISQIMYNENVQVSTEQGVPIEIANSGKVQGARYLSNSIGCSNKWSVVNTPAGIYFMDDKDKSIYLLGEGLKNLTLEHGFNTWAKNNIKDKSNDNAYCSYEDGGFRAFYDKINQDVLFINKDKALAWSEKIGAFTSFYDYNKVPWFVNLDDAGVWVTSQTESESVNTKLWKHQGGAYSRFFGVNKPYWTTLVGNPNPQLDKTFTNIEFRACVSYDNQQGEPVDTSDLPFDSLKTWNEYQEGLAQLTAKNGRGRMMHHIWNGTSEDNSLNRKFRIWRCDIPRDKNKRLDRMRNPWLYLKLMKDAAVDVTTNSVTTQHNLNRCEVHDVVMDYFV